MAYFPPLSHAVTAHWLSYYPNLCLHLRPILVLLYPYEVIQRAHDYSILFHPRDNENSFNMQADILSSLTPSLYRQEVNS